MRRIGFHAVAVLGAVWAAAASAEPGRASRPEHRWTLDGPLLGASAACYVAALALDADVRPVPAAGLDPAAIRLTIDRDALGNLDPDAYLASNILLSAAIVWPIAFGAASAPSGERWRAAADRTVLFGEALLVANGVVSVLKVGVSRPRPFTYAPEAARPDGGHYDVGQDRAFYSMPSGHASNSWCAAGFAVTDHLLTRPQAGWVERAAVGFAGGLLATATATLRVEAGQHFPTDVLAGGAIGAASGVGVPLAHRWFAGEARVPMPPSRGWLQAGAGVLLGTGAGWLLASALAE
jgi:membrane-associated phospholipid phosphatase